MVDSHCHLQMDPLFAKAGSFFHSSALSRAVVPSYSPDGWERQSSLLKLDGVSLALGWHPWCLPGVEFEDVRQKMGREFPLLSSKWQERLVAIGEFGLDRSRPIYEECFELQVEVFRLHLQWASRLELPVIIHSVRAHGKTLELLKQSPPARGGVLHSYSGPPEMVKEFSRLGMYLGFSPTLAISKKQQRALQEAGPGRILLESDLPNKRHSGTPAECLSKVVRLAAEILDKSEEWCWSIQRENCMRLFGN